MAYSIPIGFGTGFLFMTPQVAAGVANPVKVGILQDVSMDFSWDEKPLYGTAQFPVAVARGKAKLQCKAKEAQIDSLAIATVILGGTPVLGEDVIADLEAHTATSTHVTVTQAATFTTNLSVFYQTTGQPLVQTTSGSETTGQYSVSSGGVYQLAAGDSAAALFISYKYNAGTAAGGYKTTIVNQPMGAFVPFQVDLFQNNPETVPLSQWGVRLYKCMSSKFSIATKLDDWTIPEFDWSCYANAAGQVLDFNSAA